MPTLQSTAKMYAARYTAKQLETQIQYYRWVISKTTSADRQQRAHKAIDVRTAALLYKQTTEQYAYGR